MTRIILINLIFLWRLVAICVQTQTAQFLSAPPRLRVKKTIMITKATSADAAEILTLQKLAFRSEAERYNKFDIPPMVETLDEYLHIFDEHIVYKFEENGRILGSVNIRIDEKGNGKIGRLIVHPDMQNQGIGKQLMRYAEAENPQVVRFELFTGYRTQKNIQIYEKQGYTIIDTIMQDDNFGFVYMQKDNT